jgi:flagella basal body P-ring formation protein FlgA
MKPPLFCLACLIAAALPSPAQPVVPWELMPEAAVDSRGVLLSSVLPVRQQADAPEVMLLPAPAVGKFDLIPRARIAEALRNAAPGLALTNWSGAPRVRVIRRTRELGETELRSLLTEALQKEQAHEGGELELALVRPPVNLLVADEPVKLTLLDFPSSGLSQSLILRFELRTAHETFGPWQAGVRARLWREVLVAGSALSRGQSLAEADLAVERQDYLQCRDAAPLARKSDADYEITQSVPPGAVLSSRAIRRRPAVLRGRIIAALVQDGPLNITVKVEVLEDGVPGQLVRVRNLQSKREFQGKVQNEQTVLVTL